MNIHGIFILILLLIAAPAFFGCGGRDKPAADLVLKNGRILCLDAAGTEATALAAAGGTIIAIGGWPEVEGMVGGGTRVIDCGGRLVVPGLIESHAHLLGLGEARMVVDLVGTQSEEQVAGEVRRRAAELEPGRWILGRGWDQNDWVVKRFPAAHILDEAAPNHPVCLTRIDGHAIWVNRKAMELAGLTAETKDPPGGRIERDLLGNPAGVLVDNAMSLVRSKVPPPTREEKKEALLLAIRECNEFGFTGFHDAGAGAETIALYRELIAEGKLTLRLNVMLNGDDEELLGGYFQSGPVIGEGGDLLTIRSVKLYADGALGSRGAALLEEYADDPGNTGLIVDSEDRIHDVARRALEHGFQVCTHAIGDRGNRVTLDAYERALAAHPDVKNSRFRIEHAQILDEADIPRFAKLGVIAAMQAQHCTSDMPWVPDRIGDARAAEGAYVWRKLLDLGVCVPNGSDAPVESANPFRGMYAAVTRKDHRGEPRGGWYPEQCLTRVEALKSFTNAGAYASFEENLKGALEPGKLADIVILSHDVTAVAEREILETRALMTILGGKIVYEAPGVF